MSVLSGVRIIELAGIGPGPFCGMLLADLGADVIVIERPAEGPALARPNLLNRGKRSLVLDLKEEKSREVVLRLLAGADGLIEGMRPGVMERLGLGPDVCMARNPRLAYGRMTGWGQEGPLAHAAGHDINYIALSGALWYAGAPGEAPFAPPTLVGDIGGGALYLAVGMLAAILGARATGQGQVIDAAIVDGSAHMMSLWYDLFASRQGSPKRGSSLLDGPHWYATYRCADGKFMTVGSLEPKFYGLFLEKMGLTGHPDFAQQFDPRRWQAQREALAARFAERPRDEWAALFDGSDACVAPVLDPLEAAEHPHIRARGIFSDQGGVRQPRPAPRFSNAPAAEAPALPKTGAHGEAILREAGFSEAEIAALVPRGETA